MFAIDNKDDTWEEVPDEELFMDGELTNKQAMIKAWDNIYHGKYKLIRREKRYYQFLKGGESNELF